VLWQVLRQDFGMAGKIFINYRRDDSIAVAGRLHDRLAEAFGRDNLFMDVDNIPVGINFEDYLNNQVAQCDGMLSVIGSNWLNAKDETNQRRLDKPDDFVAIELSAALARNILVIPVLVDGTRMPKASELPASLKPLALRNAIQLRNTNFGSDAEQLITKMREALALERPEHTEGLVVLSFITALIASFLFNVSAFLYALAFFFIYSGNNAGLLAAFVTAFPFFMVGLVTLQRDESVRVYGLVICVGGLLAVAAILASPQFFQIDVLTDPSIQGGIPILGLFFMIFAMNFGVDWKKIASIRFASNTGRAKIMERWISSPWLAGLTFLGAVVCVLVTPQILYRLTNSLVAAFALVGVQLLVTGFCYVRYRKALAANPAQVPS
jgi:hypothetical protein